MPDKLYVGLGHDETTSLWAIAKRASACKQHRFQNLYGLIDERLLRQCWEDLNKRAASGVDGVTADKYEEDLSGDGGLLQQPPLGSMFPGNGPTCETVTSSACHSFCTWKQK